MALRRAQGDGDAKCALTKGRQARLAGHVEEVTTAELLASGIGQWCNDDGATRWQSTMAAMASLELRFGEAEREAKSE